MERLSSYIRRTIDASREDGKENVRFDVPITYHEGGIVVLEDGKDAVDGMCGRISFTVKIEGHSIRKVFAATMSPEECVEMDGHCWVYSYKHPATLEDKPARRRCKHCELIEIKIPETWKAI